jgi:PPOX class probable F420-dependent enzyme
MDASEARRRFGEARVAHLATVRPGGRPHVVPIVFVLRGERIFTVVDEKPKRTRELQRLKNVEAEPRVSVIVDHYDEDWRDLWWVRADGRARVVRDGPDLAHAIELIEERYPQERERPPRGPALVIEVDAWRHWPAG